MSWEDEDGKLCRLIREGRTDCGSEESRDLPHFQNLVASIRAFEGVGLVSNVREHREGETGHSYVDVVQWDNIPSVVSCAITQSQKQWLLLRFFKEHTGRNTAQRFAPDEEVFGGLAGNRDGIWYCCCHLAELGLIDWKTSGPPYGGGRILEDGIKALE
ncbi:hypothetical protein SDC9_170023 [bioreactor metagenome]|uniref:Uncharacterized protein n=1 Tax=bioreactor metagenome TaxID=1076179 RepID=A0A645G9E9_9ZZZZ